MRRLMTKFWKEIAYLVGLFGLGFAQISGLKVETFGMLYTGVGMAWLVLWLLRNSGGTYNPEPDLIDSRGLYGGYSDYNRRH